MSRTDDFGYHREPEGSARSETAEDATLHGQPLEEAPVMGDASSDDPDLAGSDLPDDERIQADPARLDDEDR